MAAKKNAKHRFEPDFAVAPGQTLLESIESLDMDQRELAVRTGLTPKTVNQIIKGKAPITYETALKLEQATGVPAHFWNNLETNYREALARAEERARFESNTDWLERMVIPVRELIRRGSVEVAPDAASLLKSVLRFFGTSTTAAWEKLWLKPRVAYRRSRCFETQPGACAAWLRMGELEAQKMDCQPFRKARVLKVLGEIRAMTAHLTPNFDHDLQEKCAQAGVAVVLVKEITGAPISGATRWLTSDKALIALSLRYKSDDQFWFSFFHEAGHILKGGKKAVFMDGNGDEEDEAEVAANNFAADFLIPPSDARRLGQLRSRQSVIDFAQAIDIAPGIVVGRLQREGIIPYRNLNGLKHKLAWASP